MKKFEEFINEGIIQPAKEISLFIANWKKNEPKNMEELRVIAKKYGIELLYYDEFYELMKGNCPPPLDIFTVIMKEHIYIIFKDKWLAAWFIEKPDYNYIQKALRHESVHRQQIDRSGGYMEDIDPTTPKSYLSNKREIMAMARSIVDEMWPYDRNQYLENGIVPMSLSSAPYRNEFDQNSKEIRLLKKYIYLYIVQDEIERRERERIRKQKEKEEKAKKKANKNINKNNKNKKPSFTDYLKNQFRKEN